MRSESEDKRSSRSGDARRFRLALFGALSLSMGGGCDAVTGLGEYEKCLDCAAAADAAIPIDAPPADTSATDSAADGPSADAATTCSTVTADLCEDFESGAFGPSWEGVESTGGKFTAVDGYESRWAFRATKTSSEGAAHVMLKETSKDVVRAVAATFTFRIDAAPTDLGLGGFVSILGIKGYTGAGIAMFGQSGAANIELLIFGGARVRLGAVPLGTWTTASLRVECVAEACTAYARLGEQPEQTANVAADAANIENAAQFGLNVGSAGGLWTVTVDDVVLRWTR